MAPRLTIPFLTRTYTNGERDGGVGLKRLQLAHHRLFPVILTEEAQTVFNRLGLDRDDLLLGAKSMGQTMIEDSQSSDTPLMGMVYDVWGLYDEGIPACRFSVAEETNEIVFEGKFRTESDSPFVERRRATSPEALKSLVSDAGSGLR
jgi:hypothetical protein